MYKKILKQIKLHALPPIYKGLDSKLKQPHVIFSAENPMYPENVKYNKTHEEVLDFLKQKGYNVGELQGHYGQPERSIIVYNPSKKAVRHLMNLSHDLGQESSIYSDSYNHELHFHGGKDAGKHLKGQGTAFHKKPPKDLFSTMDDGTHFTHQFDPNVLHDADKSMIGQDDKLSKSESRAGSALLIKNEAPHKLETADPDTKLIHFSPTAGLTEIDPHYHGVRRIGQEAKQGRPEHPTSFFYLEGTEPESIVTSGTQSKYVSRLAHHKLYDIGKDPENIRKELREKSMNQQINPGSYTRDDLDAAIKAKGYHGIYNSSLNDTMKNVVAMYHKVPVEKEMKIHHKDMKSATAEDHHANDQSLSEARDYANSNGHHNASFLHNLNRKFSSGE